MSRAKADQSDSIAGADLELEVLRKTKAKAMEIISAMLHALGDVRRLGGTAEDVNARLKNAVSKLGALLELIDDDGTDSEHVEA